MRNPVELSVVVVNWNHVAELLPCLRSLYDAGAEEQQVIVVDNGSVDGSVAAVRREFPAAELIETGANLGFAEGVNRGIEAARGTWVFTLNNDAVIHREGLAILGRAAREARPEVGMLQPTMLFKSRPHHVNSTGIRPLKGGFAADRDYGTLERSRSDVVEIFSCTAGAGVYRRSMLDAVRLESGWFDRTFFMYFEDLDLGWRCRLAGWRALHLPTAKVLHRYHGSSERHGSDWPWRMAKRNRVRTILKNGSARLVASSVPATLRHVAQALLRERAFEARMSDAFRDGLRQRPEVDALVKVPRIEVERRWIG